MHDSTLTNKSNIYTHYTIKVCIAQLIVCYKQKYIINIYGSTPVNKIVHGIIVVGDKKSLQQTIRQRLFKFYTCPVEVHSSDQT